MKTVIFQKEIILNEHQQMSAKLMLDEFDLISNRWMG